MPGYEDRGRTEAGHELRHGAPWAGATPTTGAYNIDRTEDGATHGQTSFAWNPDFEREAIAFEQKLGVQAFNHAAANNAAGAACTKALEYMDKRGRISDRLGSLGHTMDELLEECGGTQTFIAGNVGDDVETVRTAMTNGNIRERMTAWHHFIEHVFMGDMKAPAETFTELDTMMGEAGVQLEQIRAWRSSNATAIETGGANMYSSPIYADETGAEPAAGMVNELGAMRANSTDLLGVDHTYAQTSMTAESVAATTVQTAGGDTVHAGLSEAELDQQGVRPDQALQWSEGMKARMMNELHPWTQLMREISVPLRAGPSGHTNVFMRGNELLGVGADPDAMRLACLGYLLPINAHSMVEVLQAAKPYGTSPYVEGREIYANVAPLSEVELRNCGVPDESYPGGRLPHEMPGALANPNQQGRESQLGAGDVGDTGTLG